MSYMCVPGSLAGVTRSGTPLLATGVFHGTLTTPTPDDAKNIKGRVLVMHGADDPVSGPHLVIQADGRGW